MLAMNDMIYLSTTTGYSMNHTQHAMTAASHRRLGKRAEACADYLLALVIGTGLAALLVAWWSS
jgi:hypothetical protein